MIGFRIKTIGAVPGVAKRVIGKCLEVGYIAAGQYWHGMIRPKHFTPAGASEYGYPPRQGQAGALDRQGFKRSYTGQKLKKFGHTRPNVYTGVSRLLTERVAYRATSKGVRISMDGGNLTYRHPSGRIDMRKEMQTTTFRERAKLASIVDKVTDRRINAVRETTNTVIK